jgi:hypothetical protein
MLTRALYTTTPRLAPELELDQRRRLIAWAHQTDDAWAQMTVDERERGGR